MSEIVESAIKQLREYIKKTKQFNIFKVFKIEDYEIRHSNFLAWLLNPAETHDLGDYFLEKFQSVVNDEYNCDDKFEYNSGDEIKIYREQENIDILILNITQKYLILIENKINSNQRDNQLKRYGKIAQEKLSNYVPYFVYLKPEKNEEIPQNYKFISYEKILEILNNIDYTNVKLETSLILKNYIQILNERYEKIDGKNLIDICLKISEDKKINELSQEEKEIVWKFEQQRRYEIMQIISDTLTKIEGIEIRSRNDIYKVQFTINGNRYAFDNTKTQNSSEIYLISYEESKNEPFLNEKNYNDIFYKKKPDKEKQLIKELKEKIEKI